MVFPLHYCFKICWVSFNNLANKIEAINLVIKRLESDAKIFTSIGSSKKVSKDTVNLSIKSLVESKQELDLIFKDFIKLADEIVKSKEKSEIADSIKFIIDSKSRLDLYIEGIASNRKVESNLETLVSKFSRSLNLTFSSELSDGENSTQSVNGIAFEGGSISERTRDKLNDKLQVGSLVDKLIRDATDAGLLSQMYEGWMSWV